MEALKVSKANLVVYLHPSQTNDVSASVNRELSSLLFKLKHNAGCLTNFEVLDLLRLRGASKDPTRVMSLLTPSEFKVYDYLVESPACDQTRDCINEFLEKSKVYQLAKSEVFNIINNRPSSAAELAPIIEALEERDFDEDKLTEMAELIAQVLPPCPNQSNSEDGADEDNAAQVADEDNAAQVAGGDIAAQVADGDNAAQVADGDNAAQVADEDNAAQETDKVNSEEEMDVS